MRYESFYHRWTYNDGSENGLMLSPQVHAKLKESFSRSSSSETFDAFVSLYAKYKYNSEMNGLHPFTVPKGFYSLFRSVASITHEMFSDAIKFSGEVPHFCSIEKEDLRFGSSGPWEDSENEVEGAAGHPLFEENFLFKLLQNIHAQVKTGRPYFRALVLPYEKGTRIYDMIVDDFLGAEVVAVIRPELQAKWFIHQLNFFRYEHEQYLNARKFTHLVCEAVWINEAYQRKYSPPLDVEQCFMLWEHNDFGPGANVVDYTTVIYIFPY